MSNPLLNPACGRCDDCAGEECLTVTVGSGLTCPLTTNFIHNNAPTDTVLTCAGFETVASGGSYSNPPDLATNIHRYRGTNGTGSLLVANSLTPGSYRNAIVSLQPGIDGINWTGNASIGGSSATPYTKGLYIEIGALNHNIEVFGGITTGLGKWAVSYVFNLVLIEWASGTNSSPTVTALATASSPTSTSGLQNQAITPVATPSLSAFLDESAFPSNDWAIGVALTSVSITHGVPNGTQTNLSVGCPLATIRAAWNTTGSPACVTL